MRLIIDGYNLLGVRSQIGRAEPPGVLESARDRLLIELAAYRQYKPRDITVVFDGWREGGSVEHHDRVAGIKVIYSRQNERADQVVQRLAACHGRNCAVVSSDREVADFSKAQGALVMGAAEFRSRLDGALRPGADDGPKDVGGKDDRPRRSSTKKGNPHKLPKAERKRRRQIKGF
jgi:hypothetical protein